MMILTKKMSGQKRNLQSAPSQSKSKIVQINGVDVTDARNDQAVQMLTGLERFLRLVIERDSLVPSCPDPWPPVPSTSPAALTSLRSLPRCLWCPSPTQGFLAPVAIWPTDPAMAWGTESRATTPWVPLPPATTRRPPPTMLTTSCLVWVETLERSRVWDTASKPSVVTESITNTTFTETTVKRVTNIAVTEQVCFLELFFFWNEQIFIPQVAMRRSGEPLGLSIIGGSDHSCVPFRTGE